MYYILQATLDSAGIVDDETISHKDSSPSEIAKSERAVQQVVTAFQNFLNPFNIESGDHLYCISSGRPATNAVATDLLSVDSIGQAAYRNFIEERFVQKSVSFHAPIRKQ